MRQTKTMILDTGRKIGYITAIDEGRRCIVTILYEDSEFSGVLQTQEILHLLKRTSIKHRIESLQKGEI